MWKSVIYKEWLKIRWITIVFGMLGILAVGHIFLKVQHDVLFSKATNYWYSILFNSYRFYDKGLLKFVPLILGLVIAISQYFPETVNKRIKLTFHLPLNENKVLLIMMLFGVFCLLVVYLIIFSLFSFLCTFFFNTEIIGSTLISIIPWFLCGFTTYSFVSLIILEPLWKYRLLYLLVALIFTPVYLETAKPGAYLPAIPILIVITVILSITILFPGYRFRKGEM